MTTEPTLTPYFAELNARVGEALRALADWDDGASLDWENAETREGEWQIRIWLTTEGGARIPVFLAPAEAVSHSYFMGHNITIFPGPGPDGKDPFSVEGFDACYGPLEASIRRADDAGVEEEPLLTFLETIESFNGPHYRDDTMFRHFTHREALIRLGFRCDQDCWFCWQGRRWPEPPGKYYLKWLDEMAAAGAKKVVLTGGEPTLHKIFLPLVERASKEHQMNVQVQTNAIRFSRTKFAETAREAGVDGLFVSYHSADPDISNTMTRAPGTHAKTVAGIRSALAAGVTVTLNCCVVRDNFESLEDHARSVVDQFVTPFPANPVQVMEYSHAETAFDVQKSEEGSIPFELVRPHLHAAIRVLTEAGVTTTAIGPCGYPPCLFHGEPDLLQANIIESTFESDQRGRSYAEVCQDCTMKPHCLGVRNEYLSQHGTNGLVAFSEPVDVVLETGPDVEVGSSRRRLVISSPTQ